METIHNCKRFKNLLDLMKIHSYRERKEEHNEIYKKL